jgi:hypothetical protein
MELIFSAFIGAFIGAAIYQCLLSLVRHRRRPRLEFRINCEDPLIVAPLHNESLRTEATWIRVRICNSGGRNAKSCRAYLTDIIREGDNCDEVILKDEAHTLWASNGGDDGINAPLTISRGFGRDFDVAYFLDRSELKIPSSQYELRTKAKLASGVYLLGIAVSGANFDPITAKIEIRFDGADEPIVTLR